MDADCYLWKDPHHDFSKRYASADIVASSDPIWGPWYRGKSYLKRNHWLDPLMKQRFMLNMGLILFRSNPAVIRMFDELIAARKHIGTTWGDQTLFNEVLLQWDCEWKLPDGSILPVREEEGSTTSSHSKDNAVFFRKPLRARCRGDVYGRYSGQKLLDLVLVVVPLSVVTRNTPTEHSLNPSLVASHPGWRNKNDTRDFAV